MTTRGEARRSSSAIAAGSPTQAAGSEPAPRPLPLGRTPRVVDAVLTALLLLAAFLLASFPARNSDSWLHLATGRALVQGQYTFGTDPFTHTTDGAYWVNHTWLFDLLAYGAYQLLGGVGLVILKALLGAALCGVMLALCWAGRPRWVGVLCVGLAVLAVSPHLQLRPTVLSCLLLALTLWFLERPARSGAPADTVGRALRSYAPLLVIFVVWVNVDDWFLLGPLATGLYALGEWLQSRPSPTRKQGPNQNPCLRVGLGLTALAGLAVCLLNPHHVRAFTLPAALGPSASTEALGSPLTTAYLWSDLGRSLAGLAYFPLALLGLISFVANAPGRRWSRVLLWGVLLALSVYRSEAIPLFAVVAGPLTALNFQEFAARRAREQTPSSRAAQYASPGQAAAVVVLLVAVVVAWPGWLQPGPAGPRRWAIETDPGLVEAARQLGSWRAAGQLPADARGFNLSPESAHYLAWFGQGEKAFADNRGHLYPAAVVSDFQAVRQALVRPPPGLPGGAAQGSAAETDWRALLRKAKVTHLLVHDPSNPRLRVALSRVFAAPQEWSPIHLSGRAVIFAWHDPRSPEAGARPLPALDLTARAYHPPAARKAPAEAPGREPRARAWWEAFWVEPPGMDRDRDEALVYLAHFEGSQLAYLERRRRLWEASLPVGAAGAQAPGGDPFGALTGSALRLTLLRIYYQPLPPGPPERYPPLGRLAYTWLHGYKHRGDDGPPGLLLESIRAARRALRTNPDDPVSHLRLGEAYLRLLRDTRERAGFPELLTLRRVQAITALKHTVQLRPDLISGHAALARLYLEMGSLDLALEHLEHQLQHTQAAGRQVGETFKQFDQRVEILTATVAALGKQVRQQQNLVETQGVGRNVLERARAAEAAGLPGKALELLLGSSYTVFGLEGALMELQLFLFTGRVKEVREWMEPKQEPILSRSNYRWLQAMLGAAVGDYAAVDHDLSLLTVATADLPELGLKDVPLRVQLALQMGEYLLSSVPGRPLTYRMPPEEFRARMQGLALGLRQQGSLTVLRGVLALEQGESAAAVRLFRQGLSMWAVEGDPATELARHYLELLGA
ncbi:MAG: hypothetical protein L0Z62_44030 [Gemmataceae bacterium]|nr:hypothetical protein [Gemmataceae bacterium]